MKQITPYHKTEEDPEIGSSSVGRELGRLLREATRLLEAADLYAANETLKEATTRATILRSGGPRSPEI